MQIKQLVMSVLALLLCCPAVPAVEPQTEEAEGYILCLKPGAELSVGSDAEPLLEEEGVYYTEDLSLVTELEDLGVLDAWEEDGQVSLFGCEEDMAALKKETWSRAILGADYAAARGITGTDSQGRPVRVGIIDSGLMPDFSAYTTCTVLEGTNYCVAETSASRSDTSDLLGHGTFAASLIAATPAGAVTSQLGLAPEIELVPLKCFDSQNGSWSLIIEALGDAVDVYHCDVINMSLGDPSTSEGLKRAVDYALEAGVILVASGGNKKSSVDTRLYYPAAYDGVIAVGSIDDRKQVASHSVQNRSIWVTAPGSLVEGLTLSGGTRYASGTSYSAPMVSAAAALALSADRSLTPEGVMTLLAETAEDLGPPGWDPAYGYGMMNLGLLLATLTGDSESVIPSYYDKTLCLSFYKPPAENTVTWMARYEVDGRIFSLEELTGSLNNDPLTADAPLVKLMTVEETGFVPVRPAAAYGCDAPGTDNNE